MSGNRFLSPNLYATLVNHGRQAEFFFKCPHIKFCNSCLKILLQESDGANSEKHRRLYSFYVSTDYLLVNIYQNG